MGRKPSWETYGKCGVKKKYYDKEYITIKDYKCLVKEIPSDIKLKRRTDA